MKRMRFVNQFVCLDIANPTTNILGLQKHNNSFKWERCAFCCLYSRKIDLSTYEKIQNVKRCLTFCICFMSVMPIASK